MTTTITTATFDQAVLKSDKPVLVDFWAPWCGPCTMIAPVLTKLSNELAASHVVAKINVDEEPALAQRYEISSIPALLLFKNGKVVGTSLGFKSEPALKQFVMANS